MKRKWKTLGLALMVTATLGFYGCQKGAIDGESEGDISTSTSTSTTTSESETLTDNDGIVATVDTLTATLTGSVTDDLGNPVDGATVSAFGSSTTTVNGTWSMEGVPVSQVITQQALAGFSNNPGAFGNQGGVVATVPVTITAPGHASATAYVGTTAVVTESNASLPAAGAGGNATGAGAAGTGGATTNNSQPNTLVLTGLAGTGVSVNLPRLAATVSGYLIDPVSGVPHSGVSLTLEQPAIPGGILGAGAVIYGFEAQTVGTSGSGQFVFQNVPTNMGFTLDVDTIDVAPAVAPGTALTARGGGLIATTVDPTGTASTFDIAAGAVAANGIVLGDLVTIGGFTYTVNNIQANVDADENPDTPGNVDRITVSGGTFTSASVASFFVQTAGSQYSTNNDGTVNITEVGMAPVVNPGLGACANPISGYTCGSSWAVAVGQADGTVNLGQLFAVDFEVVDSVNPYVSDIRYDLDNNVGVIQLDDSVDLNTVPLTFYFNEDMAEGRFDITSDTPSEAVSIIIFDTNNNQYTIDPRTTLSGNQLDIYVNETVPGNAVLQVRLKKSDFWDMSENYLGLAPPSLNLYQPFSTVWPVNTPANRPNTGQSYWAYNVNMYNAALNDPGTGNQATNQVFASLADVSNGADSALTNYVDDGSFNAPAALTAANTAVVANTKEFLQLNDPSADTDQQIDGLGNPILGTSRLDILALSLSTQNAGLGWGVAPQVFGDVGGVTVDTNAGSTYTATSSRGGSVIYDATNGVGLNGTQFTGSGTGQQLLIDGAQPGDVITITPTNSFGDLVSAGQVQVTLADTVSPTVAIQSQSQSTLLNNNSATGLSGGNVVDGSQLPGEPPIDGSTSGISRLLFLTASLYDNTESTRNKSLVDNDQPLLANSNGTTYSTNRAGAFYTAADYTSWLADLSTRPLLIQFTENLTLPADFAATVTGNTSTDATLSTETTGITDITAASNENNLLVSIGDWRTIADGSVLPFEGLTDTAGNAAKSDSQLVLVDRTPPLATSASYTDNVLTITFDQPISTDDSGQGFADDLIISGGGVGDPGAGGSAAPGVTYTVNFDAAGDTITSSSAYVGAFGGAVPLTTPVTATITDSTTLTLTVPAPTTATSTDMSSYFALLSLRAVDDGNTNNSDDIRVQYRGVIDNNGESWNNVQVQAAAALADAGNANNTEANNEAVQNDCYVVVGAVCRHPEIIIPDDEGPRVAAAVGIPNTTRAVRASLGEDNGQSQPTRLLIHTGTTTSTIADGVAGAGVPINSGTAEVGAADDGVWDAGDNATGGNQVYQVAFTFRENIVCGAPTDAAGTDCGTTGATATIAPVTTEDGAAVGLPVYSTPDVIKGADAQSVVVTFNLTSGQAHVGDTLTLNVSDYAGNATALRLSLNNEGANNVTGGGLINISSLEAVVGN